MSQAEDSTAFPRKVRRQTRSPEKQQSLLSSKSIDQRRLSRELWNNQEKSLAREDQA